MNNTSIITNTGTINASSDVMFMIFNVNYLIKIIIKLLLSTGFSFIIGYEREMHSHPGGICTHVLVGYGSCLYTMVSVNLRNAYTVPTADPARIRVFP